MEVMCPILDKVKAVWAKEDGERRTERWDGIGQEGSSMDTSIGLAKGPDSRGITSDWIHKMKYARQAIGYVHQMNFGQGWIF
jgi:hypothetical protein